jgi:hypothetical protein
MSEIKITPLARRLAEENGIDWRQIRGTGPDGTVVERDILAFLARVMAGEVNLPPVPEDVAPQTGSVPNLAQAQAALQKEGVELGDLMPPAPATTPPAPTTTPPAPPPQSAAPSVDDLEFDLDLDLDAPTSPLAPAVFEEAPSLVPEPSLVSDFEEPEPLAASKPLPTLQWEDPEPVSSPPASAGPWSGVDPELAALPPLPSETDLEPVSSAPKLIWETQEVVVAPEVPPATASPLQAGMSFTNIPNPTPAGPVASPAPEAAAETPPAPPAEQQTPPEPTGTPLPIPTALAASPAVKAVRVQAWQRLVEIGPAQDAAQALSEAWRVEVGLYPLLYRAVDKALADTQTPLRATKGSLEGDQLQSLRVTPAQSLRGALDSLGMASEPGEGLTVLSLVDTHFDQVIFPGTPTLTLGRASGGHALLSLSGQMESDQAGKLLERIAYYLERPILLA